MYDSFAIIQNTGNLVWSFGKLDDQAINDCILNQIIPKNTPHGIYHYKKLNIDFLQQSSLVFLAIYSSSLHLPFTKDLLNTVAMQFQAQFPEIAWPFDTETFKETFVKVVQEYQKREFANVSKETKNSSEKAKNSSVKGKQKRVWDNGKVTQKDLEELDYSATTENPSTKPTKTSNATQLIDQSSMGQKTKQGFYEAKELTVNKKSNLFSWLNFETTIEETKLEPILIKMKEHLIQKNVASDIATHLCDTVGESMVGQKLKTFSSLTNHVKSVLQEQLKRILTPKTSSDLLMDILKSKKQKKPYSVVFVGVNGVGKSTNLSKVCFWLLQNNFKILIAACDTFRSGAVEQLHVHARNLKSLMDRQDIVVDLYEKGYGKDAASIAKDAVTYAATHSYDVVLIDTAGRMQNNEPLMRALAKLVTVNQPDKIIFVGEALVGNEAVDQLTKFNLALKDYSGVQKPRQIDGMILTKFDTIDDKVGAALTMTFITGQPIYFVGTGQTYTDLRKLDIQTIVETLLS